MRRMRLPLIATIVALIAFGGCGDQGEATPVACLEGELVYLDALEAAPGVAELDGTTPISECLAENQSGGELANIGAAMLNAATELNGAAREQPGAAATPGFSAAERSPSGVLTYAAGANFDGGCDLSEQLWGGETTKAIENFPVSGEPVPVPVVRWLGRLKAAAARVNGELGGLDSELAAQIAGAGDAVAAGEHDDQFPVDVFQTGSGTSSNMNANEVIANLAGDAAHPNDHVNMGQSSNDVFPSAVHLAALDEVTHDLLPAMEGLQAALTEKAERFADTVKAGRTHLMDAGPVTLGQEFGGYAAQVRLGMQRVEGTLRRVGQVPLGGTATGTGLNTHPEFAAKVREQLAEDTGLGISC